MLTHTLTPDQAVIPYTLKRRGAENAEKSLVPNGTHVRIAMARLVPFVPSNYIWMRTLRPPRLCVLFPPVLTHTLTPDQTVIPYTLKRRGAENAEKTVASKESKSVEIVASDR